jgi:hypothetical protein
MKRNLILFVLLMGVIYFINACKELSTTETGAEPIVADASFYPAKDGTSYKYNVEKTDSNDEQTTGERYTWYLGTDIKEDVVYQVQFDTVTLSNQTTAGLSYFRKTETGVFFFLDTTGFAASIGDSIIQNLTFNLEMRLLLFPIEETSNWDVFNITFQDIFNPIVVSASFDGTETLMLNLSSSNTEVETVRLKFTLKYQTDPFSAAQNFYANGWLAKDIGFVKWEGSGTIVGAFTGNGVDFADTNSTVVMNLTEPDIK